MATYRSQNAKHSDRDVDIALKRKRRTEPETVSPPELTIPGTQARHFEIVSLKWERTDVMSRKLTEHVNQLAKQSKAVVVLCGQSQDEHCITYTLEWWTY